MSLNIGQKHRVDQIGNSIGLVLPEELCAKLGLGEGDSIAATETPTGIELTPWDEVKQRQLETAERVIQKNQDMLRKLAE